MYVTNWETILQINARYTKKQEKTENAQQIEK